MKSSQILRLAKRRLAKNTKEIQFKEVFICIALKEVGADTGDMRVIAKVNKLKDLIRKRLQGCYTYPTWLVNYVGVSEYHAENATTKLQRSRHAWVDSLIVEFEAKGD
jgi:hypothetical protein